VAFGAGLAKGGLGGALGGMITPMLSLFMDVKIAIAFALPLFIIADWLSVRSYWKVWDGDQLKWLFPPGLIGVGIGTYLLANLSNATLRDVLGVLTLVVGLYKLAEPFLKNLQFHPRPIHAIFAGALSGTGSALASAGGPIFTGYLLFLRLEPRVFIGTTAIFFAVSNLTRLPALYLADVFEWDKFVFSMMFAPLAVLGVLLGRYFVNRIDRVAFERLMTAILIVAGILLIVQ
jgi:hypothetical protein